MTLHNIAASSGNDRLIATADPSGLTRTSLIAITFPASVTHHGLLGPHLAAAVKVFVIDGRRVEYEHSGGRPIMVGGVG